MFGERMKEQREFTEPRLRQEDVGKILGMSQRKISRLEKVKAPRSPGVVPPGQLPKEKIIKELKERKEIRLWKQ